MKLSSTVIFSNSLRTFLENKEKSDVLFPAGKRG